MTLPHQPLRWKNASSGEDTCVDVAHTLEAVRDSKNPDVVLALPRPAVSALMQSIR
jgi:hypothetical protein